MILNWEKKNPQFKNPKLPHDKNSWTSSFLAELETQRSLHLQRWSRDAAVTIVKLCRIAAGEDFCFCLLSYRSTLVAGSCPCSGDSCRAGGNKAWQPTLKATHTPFVVFDSSSSLWYLGRIHSFDSDMQLFKSSPYKCKKIHVRTTALGCKCLRYRY